MLSARPPLVLTAGGPAGHMPRLVQVLRGAAYEVLEATSSDSALALVQARAPDLALLDLAVPGMAGPAMSGIDLCRQLHDLPGCAELPVIFVAAAEDRQQLVAAFDAGAVDYVTPPLLAEELRVRVRNHLDLKQARDRLNAMLRERREVTEVVAHDIKNPLSSILFGAQLLLQSKETPVPRGEITRDIQICAEEALRFIRRFLTRAAEGQRLRQFQAQRVALAELAGEAIKMQKAAAEARGVRMVVDGDAMVSADRVAARNVLQNLLSNAIRHSPKGEQIKIEISAVKPGFSRCRVLDRGPGVGVEDRDRLFQRYVQFAAARERPRDGGDYSNGLGLAIAKHDVAEMGGHLWYEPRPGGGSVFGFDLPQQPPAERAPT